MTKDTIHNNRKKLSEEKKVLLSRIELLLKGESADDEGKSKESPAWVDYGQKTDENAAEVAQYADNVSIKESLQSRVTEIENALDAIQKGTYGKCEECGNAIEDARLKIMPTATLCLNCKKNVST